jgi:hypothetical protein
MRQHRRYPVQLSKMKGHGVEWLSRGFADGVAVVAYGTLDIMDGAELDAQDEEGEFAVEGGHRKEKIDV